MDWGTWDPWSSPGIGKSLRLPKAGHHFYFLWRGGFLFHSSTPRSWSRINICTNSIFMC